MDYDLGTDGELRLSQYFARIGNVLANQKRRASFALYAMGIIGDGERKSVEPIAARTCADPDTTDAVHQRLCHFLTDSQWSDRDVRRAATRYVVDALIEQEPISAWIIDDTGFLKQGKHSVGVQRQYTGSAGKITNCQIGVSLSVATRSEHVPIDFELYLPHSWADDPMRRQEARIPDEVQFKTKPELAIEMLTRAVTDQVPKGVLLADSAYGNSSSFRETVRSLGLDYAVGVDGKTKVWRADKLGRRRGAPISCDELAWDLRFRKVTWREGSQAALSSQFAMKRVVSCHDDGREPAEREDMWLVVEWPDGEPNPSKFFFATLPRGIRKKSLVRIIKERYRTERVYQDLKGELGLDHFEGRRFRGWHHHVSVTLCCFAFIVAERVRHFPPSASWTSPSSSLTLAA